MTLPGASIVAVYWAAWLVWPVMTSVNYYLMFLDRLWIRLDYDGLGKKATSYTGTLLHPCCGHFVLWSDDVFAISKNLSCCLEWAMLWHQCPLRFPWCIKTRCLLQSWISRLSNDDLGQKTPYFIIKNVRSCDVMCHAIFFRCHVTHVKERRGSFHICWELRCITFCACKFNQIKLVAIIFCCDHYRSFLNERLIQWVFYAYSMHVFMRCYSVFKRQSHCCAFWSFSFQYLTVELRKLVCRKAPDFDCRT